MLISAQKTCSIWRPINNPQQWISYYLTRWLFFQPNVQNILKIRWYCTSSVNSSVVRHGKIFSVDLSLPFYRFTEHRPGCGQHDARAYVRDQMDTAVVREELWIGRGRGRERCSSRNRWNDIFSKNVWHSQPFMLWVKDRNRRQRETQ